MKGVLGISGDSGHLDKVKGPDEGGEHVEAPQERGADGCPADSGAIHFPRPLLRAAGEGARPGGIPRSGELRAARVAGRSVCPELSHRGQCRPRAAAVGGGAASVRSSGGYVERKLGAAWGWGRDSGGSRAGGPLGVRGGAPGRVGG